ncbi:MAG: hydroxymethylglutaryl-CoA reductase, degradative [Promethearchaeota archaeon]
MHSNKSPFSGFYKKSFHERQKILAEWANLTSEEVDLLKTYGYFTESQLDQLVENTIGVHSLPIGVATNFLINDKEFLVPMVTEEPSVIAAASNGARFARKYGGFHCEPVASIMIGQIQITHISPEENESIKKSIIEKKTQLLAIANGCDALLIKLGGGATDLQIRQLDTTRGKMLVLHLLVNVLDVMGANVVNTMVEAIATEIACELPVTINLRIISNLAIHRLAKCQAIFDPELLGGKNCVENILDAYAFAQADPFRAATHNKGIMNGITALALATGNDTRAIEAGAHAYATYNSKNGRYGPLSHFYQDDKGRLVGELTLPAPFAIVGGIIKSHPMAQLAIKILKITRAEELSQIAAAVGLAQNIAALRALSAEGIQQGHMKLHLRKF